MFAMYITMVYNISQKVLSKAGILSQYHFTGEPFMSSLFLPVF